MIGMAFTVVLYLKWFPHMAGPISLTKDAMIVDEKLKNAESQRAIAEKDAKLAEYQQRILELQLQTRRTSLTEQFDDVHNQPQVTLTSTPPY